MRIGRNPDNELVTDVPTVSRQHAVLRWGPGGWEFENTGSAPTFVNGQQVTRVTVDRPLALVLGSADGPVLRAEPGRRPRRHRRRHRHRRRGVGVGVSGRGGARGALALDGRL